jgi:hypothetical protein
MKLSSAAFEHGNAIPSRFTCEGENISPELSWNDVPAETNSFVLIVHDPDAPREGGFTHWVLYNIPGDTDRIGENISKSSSIVPGLGTQGRNDSGKIGYTGPCPPSGNHRYFFRLYAVRSDLGLQPGATHAEVLSAMRDKIIAEAEIMGTYTKKAKRAA